jgi:hypothetical protein
MINMHLQVASFAVVAFLATSACVGAPQAPAPDARPAPAPALVVEPPEVNFGRVEPGSKHPARFLLRNAGSAPLTIASAKPSCKCTDVSPIEGKTIPPGGTLELTAALQVPRSPGEKDAKVMISVAGSPGTVLAKMVADVTQPVRSEPPFVDALKGVSAGTIRLSSIDGAPFRVLSAGGKVPDLVGFDPAKDAPRSSYEIRWSVAAIGSPLPQWWVVDTDRTDCPQVPLRIRHETTGVRFDPDQRSRFWFPPESVVLAGTAKAGQPVRLSTTIEHINPAAQGRVTAPDWGKVSAITVPGGEGAATLVSVTPRGADFVDLSFDFVPAAGRAGALYVPVRITTPTGSGNVFVAVTVAP